MRQVRTDYAEEERIAQNDATFREANERLAATPVHQQSDDPLVFLCECADRRCTAIIRVPRGEYRLVRSQSRRFVCVPGHESDADRSVHVIRRGDGYVVVEKTGRAGEVAEELDEAAGRDGNG